MEEKKRGRGIKAVLTVVLIAICLGIGFVVGNWQAKPQQSNILSKMQYIQQYINEYYLNDVDAKQEEEYIYKGMLAGLGDPYSIYYTKEEYAKLTESLDGNYTGIGVRCEQDRETGEVIVVDSFRKGSAYEVGIRAGDRIVKVNGESILDQDLTSIVSMIRGEENTTVELTVYQLEEEKNKNFTVERRETENETVTYKLLSDKIGYIEVTEFDEVTAEQFKEALNSLEEDGMESLIIDLRNNGGGVLTSTCQMLDELLPRSLLTYTEDKNGKRKEYWAEENNKFTKPLVILVNGQSASASELFSGAVKDYGIGTIVGTQTFGKGIVQSLIPMPDGSAVKLTVSKYYTPNGVCIHETGIEPDVKVELPKSVTNPLNVKTSQDTQLKKAIEILKEKMQK